MNKFFILGMGPGNPLYMLPAVNEALRSSDVIIGGKRNLDSIDTSGKEVRGIDSNLTDVVDYIKANRDSKRISVLASGDPGFYGILGFLKRHFNKDEFEVIPGLSSVQYMFSKIGLCWEEAFLGSVHGRSINITEIVKRNNMAAFLTDANNSYLDIAEILCENGLGNRTMYAGFNLSYDNEEVVKDRAKNFIGAGYDPKLCVVVITDE